MIERYKRLQAELADDLRGLWDPTFERLGGPDADLEAAWSLCSWLTISGAAYERDAIGALNPDWKATAQARSALLSAVAEVITAMVESLTGVTAPDEVRNPPPPEPSPTFPSSE